MAHLAEKGLLPLSGGMLDQTEKFRAAAQFVWAETAQWRIEELRSGLRA